jgi:hypothetical protein
MVFSDFYFPKNILVGGVNDLKKLIAFLPLVPGKKYVYSIAINQNCISPKSFRSDSKTV